MTEGMTQSRVMRGKRGLVMGVANDHSIAWGVARTLHAHGATLALGYQNEQFDKRVAPLALAAGGALMLPADVTRPDTLDAAFETLRAEWRTPDFIVHAIAYADKAALQGRFGDTGRDAFLQALDISCYSFIDVTRRAAALMPAGGAALTMSYLGAQRVMPTYNVMGVAKAALEASVRYLAADYGPDGIRVNALSPGPMRTLAGTAVGGARRMFKAAAETAPLRRNAQLEEIGGAAMFLLSPLGGGVTGEVMFVDCGYHAMGMAPLEQLASA